MATALPGWTNLKLTDREKIIGILRSDAGTRLELRGADKYHVDAHRDERSDKRIFHPDQFRPGQGVHKLRF